MSSEAKPRGCLAALFGGSKVEAANPAAPTYRVRADFLSTAELSFLRTAQIALSSRFAIMVKVNLADVFFSPSKDQGARNRIDRKHVDFLLCDPQTLRPMLGIELDDASHQRADRVERDRFVDGVFASAGLPLVHFPVRAAYVNADIVAAIEGALKSTQPAHTAPVANTTPDGVPLCPRCAVPMVRRSATRGANAGGEFFGCTNYPRCREIIPIRSA